MTSRQCHARNKSRQRCSQPADHEGDHYIMIEWMDSDSYDPDIDMPVPFVPTMGGSIRGPAVKGEGVLRTFNEATGGFDDTLIEEDADLLGETGKCFSCGFGEADHDSNPHGCRTYVP